MNSQIRRFAPIVLLHFACITGALLAQEGRDKVTTYSLADDFSYTNNGAASTWSYRLDDSASPSPSFPLLTLAKRNSNELWGSDFPKPPLMWSEESGYWGIGRNDTSEEQVSSKNGTRWARGEVLFHPKSGGSPAGLVIGWTAPERMLIDVSYTFGRGSLQGNGIGYEILRRSDGKDAHLVDLRNIGSSVSNELNGLLVAKGEQLFFRFNTSGDASGDITRAGIVINGRQAAAKPVMTLQPSGGTVMAGSKLTLTATSIGEGTLQWYKDGKPVPNATSASYHLRRVNMDDAGTYSVVMGAATSADAILKVNPQSIPPEPYPSHTPKEVFSDTLAEQERELMNSELMQRFAVSRDLQSADPYRPIYHFVSPESQLNDPNGLCFWQGRWHMFYQAYPPDEYPDPADIYKRRQHWGHAVSEDLIHWRDLPYAIYPGIERMCFSGSTVVESDRVIAYYLGIAAGQMVATSSDPLLLNWQKSPMSPVNSPAGDSCIWKEGDTYYGLVGADNLVSSTDLLNWPSQGAFIQNNPFPMGDAYACPGFVPIGDKHLLTSFSHIYGGQYLLGDYDQQAHKFTPYAKGLFNHGRVSPGGVHAPSVAADGQGGVINILNINDGRHSDNWDQIMSLAQQLTLGPDSQLRIAPVVAVEALRTKHQHVGETVIPANEEIVFDQIEGNAMELNVEIDPLEARWVRLNVLRSPDAEEQTSITFYNFDRALSIWYHTPGEVVLDGTRSSKLPDVWLRPPERTVMPRAAGETLRLRVFVDRSVVEVFVNERHYLAMRVYPGREDSLGVSLQAQGQDATLKKLDAWQMQSIWP